MTETGISPPHNRGMMVLDRDAFKRTFTTLAIRAPFLRVRELTTQLEDDLLNLPRIQNVAGDGDSKQTKLILLKLDLKDIEELPKYDLIKEYEIISYEFTVDYVYWTTEQILYSIMPEGDAETPSSFTTTGHIAHVNLKKEDEPFKKMIAQVILDKNKKIKSVVNKTNQIDNTYRNFEMEVLAGDNNMITELRENECRFKFDFSKVYWNSRLQAEHRRLVNLFKKGEYICDVMAGVGPFSIPAAKKGSIVYANDLNPSSYQWLNENIKLNKLNYDQIKTFNMDGREFIKQSVNDLLKETDRKITFSHFVMNLPASAIEFLDAFKGLYKNVEILPDSLPMIHCHCFTKSMNPEEDIKQRVCQIMGETAPTTINLHWVRTVAPKKDMYCVSFRLGPEVAFSK